MNVYLTNQPSRPVTVRYYKKVYGDAASTFDGICFKAKNIGKHVLTILSKRKPVALQCSRQAREKLCIPVLFSGQTSFNLCTYYFQPGLTTNI